MKEIKFKIPIFENGKFNHFDLVEAKISETSYNFGSCGYYTTQKIEIKEPLQFTGLKDKNGKEIYEGDICKYNVAVTGKYQDFERIGVVTWNDEEGAFRFKDNRAGIMRDFYVVTSTEIIGNIYENPNY